ncbi:helix-turn-helix transcriptional regulator [Actinokineospora sp. NBRC 105648]|uniref:helix-turn-helix domain-containing protein n=1 Tax=Actinokineospora sp. NBRC 105648 TaxID=3032206 RepID=UPI0024A2F4F2|nr:helix-turn-helix transcriptional regulator [Actinokineospora sp. NBRC 105648]GLZ43448.1 hypothetical protein Acsp05_70720 [Actinokineospora sp. NBRC 105648]
MTLAATSADSDQGDESAVPVELVDALRDGPFHHALDVAFRQRGLSLEAVQRRIAGRGAGVSQATLSYWRRGGRRPDGDKSMRAVRALEETLGVPKGALVRLIGQQRPRGRWAGDGVGDGAVGLATVLDLAEPAAIESCEGIDLEGNGRLALMSVQQHLRVSAERTELSVYMELVVMAKANGVDRWVSFYLPPDGDGHRPVITRTECCRLGRVRMDPETELAAVELPFDYPLRAGETYVFGFEITYAGAPAHAEFIQYGLRTPARQLLVRASFDERATPVRCYRYFKPKLIGDESVRESELPLGPSMTCHIAVLDAPPGVHGIRWEWE